MLLVLCNFSWILEQAATFLSFPIQIFILFFSPFAFANASRNPPLDDVVVRFSDGHEWQVIFQDVKVGQQKLISYHNSDTVDHHTSFVYCIHTSHALRNCLGKNYNTT